MSSLKWETQNRNINSKNDIMKAVLQCVRVHTRVCGWGHFLKCWMMWLYVHAFTKLSSAKDIPVHAHTQVEHMSWWQNEWRSESQFLLLVTSPKRLRLLAYQHQVRESTSDTFLQAAYGTPETVSSQYKITNQNTSYTDA